MSAQVPPLTAHVEGVGVIGPGLPDWRRAVTVLAGTQPCCVQPTVIPPATGLPAAERRRAGTTVRLAIAAGLQAIADAAADPSGLPAVFASSGADGLICHEICETLASADRQLSPTRFHNSVHNAAAGYWGLATGATAASTALCAYDGSFAAGLLESLTLAASEDTSVLLTAYETVYPEPLHAKRPLPDAFAAALVLSPKRTARSRARLSVTLMDASTPVDRMSDPALEGLRKAIPAARSLPLLAQLARGAPGRVVLDYLDGLAVAVQVSECR